MNERSVLDFLASQDVEDRMEAIGRCIEAGQLTSVNDIAEKLQLPFEVVAELLFWNIQRRGLAAQSLDFFSEVMTVGVQ